MKILLSILSGLLASVAAGQGSSYTSGRPLPAAQAAFDVGHYDLALEVDPGARTIEGRLVMTATLVAATPEVVLDLDQRLEVRRVTDGEADLPFTHAEGEILIRPPGGYGEVGGEIRVEVRYGGMPREAPNPPWDGGFTWATTRDGAPWIATSCQDQGADLWWPCKDQPDDEPSSMDLHFTVPAGLTAVSNGRLTGIEEAAEGRRTFHWHVSTPINNYGVALNVAPYWTITTDYRSVTGETFPVTYWVLPEHLAPAIPFFADVLRQMRWCEETFGPYPFRADKYGVVETPHLGMEHQTIVAYGNRYRGNPWGPDQGFDFLHHHEFTHEWWANLVTARNWNDFWIHESFATYAQSLYAEHLHGPEALRVDMAAKRRLVRNRAAFAPAEPHSTAQMTKGPRAPGNDAYYKGAWVLHTLRWLMGDEAFFRALRRLAYPDPALEATTDGSACRFAATDEVVAVFAEHAGRKLDWFFTLYLRQPALPRLRHGVRDGALHLEWETPDHLPFPLPVPVRVGDELRRVEMPHGRGHLALGAGDPDPEIDPYHHLLMER